MKKPNIAIIGLGYVGLPLAIEFGKHFTTSGFDFKDKINLLKKNFDPNYQINKKDFLKSKNLNFLYDFKLLNNFDFIIVTVPTPINNKNIPNLLPLKNACIKIGSNIKKNTRFMIV